MLLIFIIPALRGLCYGSFLPTWMYLFESHTGVSILGLGLLGALFEGTKLLCEIPTGHWADVRGEHKSVLTGSSLLVSSFAFLSTSNVYFIAVGMILMALSECFVAGAYEAWLQRAQGQNKLSQNLLRANRAWLTGFVIAALMSSIFSPQASKHVWLASGCFAIATCFCVLLAMLCHPVQSYTPTERMPLRQKLVDFGSKSHLQYLGIAFFFSSFAFDGLSRFYQIDLGRAGINPQHFGPIAVGISISALALQSLMAMRQQRSSTLRLLKIDASIGAGFLLLAIAAPLALRAPLIILLAACEDLRNPLQAHALSEQTQGRTLATNLSILSIYGAFGELVSGPVSAFCVRFASFQTLWLFYALCFAAAAAALWRSHVRLRA